MSVLCLYASLYAWLIRAMECSVWDLIIYWSLWNNLALVFEYNNILYIVFRVMDGLRVLI